MEIDVTMVMENPENWIEFSSSIAERGENCGTDSWKNAMNFMFQKPLMTIEQLPVFKKYIETFGAWEDEQIEKWTPQECNALLVQLVAGNARERQHFIDEDREDEYEENHGGSLEKCDDKWYYYVGS